ncbi:MAG: hypothetical protein EXS04_00955 [Phycisphaerales bacterium]|nr:hypothetical protein [Phycisphaerales bacterium]
MQQITLRASVVAILFLASVRAADAQNALGGGDALSRDTRHSDPRMTSNQGVLDANSRVGGQGENGARAKEDYFSRNLIVTGDVAGGRGFRGSVGYREQSEFTGQTGSDDNRSWRAYSVYSSPYMAQATYNPLQASQAFGAIMYTRTYANASARDILTNQQPLDARIAFDRFTADSGKKMKRMADIIDPANARDTSDRLNWRVTQAISAASGREARREQGVDDLLGNMGLSTYDRQRLKQDILQGRTKREMVGDPLSQTSLLPGDSLADTARLRPTLAPEYSSIYESLRARAGDRIPVPASEADRAARAKEIEKELTGDMDWLRDQLMRSGSENRARGVAGPRAENAPIDPSLARQLGTDGKESDATKQDGMEQGADSGKGNSADRTNGADQGNGTNQGNNGDSTKRDDGTGSGRTRDSKNADGSATEKVDSVVRDANGRDRGGMTKEERDRQPSVDDLAFILRHGRKLQSLVPEDSSAIKDMMELGATSMTRGEFFRAEERFASVLAVLPNNAGAMAGVANAQMGAGLSVSAALTLRKLFAMHPEMIDTHLGTEILPPADRIEAALAAARERLAAANSPKASTELQSDRFDFGLVISYIGFQTDRSEVIREGLDAMRQTRPDDAMLGILQRIWLPVAADPTLPASPSVR